MKKRTCSIKRWIVSAVNVKFRPFLGSNLSYKRHQIWRNADGILAYSSRRVSSSRIEISQANNVPLLHVMCNSRADLCAAVWKYIVKEGGLDERVINNPTIYSFKKKDRELQGPCIVQQDRRFSFSFLFLFYFGGKTVTYGAIWLMVVVIRYTLAKTGASGGFLFVSLLISLCINRKEC